MPANGKWDLIRRLKFNGISVNAHVCSLKIAIVGVSSNVDITHTRARAR